MAGGSGKFITLEGGEGAGKSTQIELLSNRLSQSGIEAVTTREPGGAEGAEAIRALLVNGDTGRWEPMSEALLHFAARKEHVEKLIIPALAGGKWVISDRFADSTMAYQGFAQGLGQPVIAGLYETVLGDFRPDLTLILDLPVNVGLERANVRLVGKSTEDRYERMGEDFHRRLHDAFHLIAKAEPERCRIIDASGDIETVAEQVWRAVSEKFGF